MADHEVVPLSGPVDTRIVSFCGTTVRLDYTRGRSAEIVDFLFRKVPCAPAGDGPGARLSLLENPSDGVFTVSSGERICCVDRSAAAVASWLLHLTCRQLTRGENGLLIHAGVVAWKGRALLLPGTTGSGKSTLTAFLASSGFRYLTDELAYVPSGSISVEGFTAPLKIKKSGLDSLAGRVPLDAGASMAGRHDVLVDPDGGGGDAPAALPLSVIIFPRYRRRTRFSLAPLSPAKTALRLIAGILNAEALPDHGFREASRLAGLTTGYDLRYANLGQIEAHLDVLRRIAAP
jgi:hypothetical protein